MLSIYSSEFEGNTIFIKEPIIFNGAIKATIIIKFTMPLFVLSFLKIYNIRSWKITLMSSIDFLCSRT